MLVELDGLGFPDVGVELVRAIITRTQRDAVVGHIIQETRLCGPALNTQCGHIGARQCQSSSWKSVELTRETL